MSILKKIEDNVIQFLVSIVILGGLYYLVTTTYKLEQGLKTLVEDSKKTGGDTERRFQLMQADIEKFKRCVVHIQFAKEKQQPSSLLDCVLGGTPIAEGIKAYKGGNYSKAFELWEPAVREGDTAAAAAVALMAKEIRNEIQILNAKEMMPHLQLTDIEKQKLVKLRNANKMIDDVFTGGPDDKLKKLKGAEEFNFQHSPRAD